MMYLIALTTMAAADAPAVTTGPVEKAVGDFKFTEGPVWLPEGLLVFSDIPADTIYKADGTVFRTPSGKSNGLTLDRKGRLIACEHWNRRVTRTEKDGAITVLADAYDGKKFNSPNDVVVRSDGVIFFTDPPYGLEGRAQEIDFSGIYAILPGGEVILLNKTYSHPNGLAFSPDEKMLYVGDSKAGLIDVFDMGEGPVLENGRRFCDVPGPDGMKVDAEGRLWSTAQDGMRLYATDGTLLATIPMPERPANCAFGDADRKTLYITARTTLYRVRCAVPGLPLSPP